MLATIDFIARRVMAWPLALIGIVCVQLGGGLIHTAAWVADIDVNNEDEYL